MTPTPEPSASLWIAAIEMICALLAMTAAWAVYFRDGRWRRGRSFKDLVDQAARAEQKADAWHQTPEAKAIRDKLAAHELLLSDHDNALEHVATKEDIAKLGGQIDVTQETVRGAAGAIERIEEMLIRRALNPERT